MASETERKKRKAGRSQENAAEHKENKHGSGIVFVVAKPEAGIDGREGDISQALGGEREWDGKPGRAGTAEFAEEYLIISPFFFCPLPTC